METAMPAFLTEEFAADFAAEWIAAWNARQLERILKHYARDIEFASPFVSRLLPHQENTLRGLALLRIYFGRVLNAYPDLHFVARRAYVGAQSLVIEHESTANLLAAEMMEFNEVGLVYRARAHYTAAEPISEMVSIRFVS
jgi:hypothetical protein